MWGEKKRGVRYLGGGHGGNGGAGTVDGVLVGRGLLGFLSMLSMVEKRDEDLEHIWRTALSAWAYLDMCEWHGALGLVVGARARAGAGAEAVDSRPRCSG